MLQAASRSKPKAPAPARFAVVASKYNDNYVSSMLKVLTLILKSLKGNKVRVFRVPGAFEIPVVVSKLAKSTSEKPDVIITLGVIMRGETTHAEHIAVGVTHALALIQVETGIPVVHGVYQFETRDQAGARCLDPKYNRGKELAHTALEMAVVIKSLPN